MSERGEQNDDTTHCVCESHMAKTMNEIHDRTAWQASTDIEAAVSDVRSVGHDLTSPADLDQLVERFGDRKYVLIGDATHGTSEFYRRSRPSASGSSENRRFS